VNNLPKVVTRQRRGRESNLQPLSRKSNALTTGLPSHQLVTESSIKIPPHRECVATLPWEISGTVLTHNGQLVWFLCHLVQCTCTGSSPAAYTQATN